MEKKYTFDDGNEENDKVQEPAIAYEGIFSAKYSIKELRAKFDRAVKQAEAGEVLTHEEIKNRYKK
ncbi:MAG: hypothetical protein LUH15_10865 [Tannerellaceae bacterium]|nr:hypothetical protein [Tannerellaceae bacterium]